MSVLSLITSHEFPIISCLPDEFMDRVVDQMTKCGRGAILVQTPDRKTVGIITAHDIMRAVTDTQNRRRHLANELAKDWMTPKVVTCPIDTKLGEALNLMGKHKVHHLVLTEQGAPVAIVNIRDLLVKIHDNDLLEINVLRDMALLVRGSQAA